MIHPDTTIASSVPVLIEQSNKKIPTRCDNHIKPYAAVKPVQRVNDVSSATVLDTSETTHLLGKFCAILKIHIYLILIYSGLE